MSRAPARPFTFVAALSLLLAAGATVLVVRSYWVTHRLSGLRFDDKSLTWRTDDFKLSSGRLVYTSGRKVFFTRQEFARRVRINTHMLPGWTHDRVTTPILNFREVGTRGDESWRVLGLAYEWYTHDGSLWRSLQRNVVLPPWALIAPWLVLPAWWLRWWWGGRFARRPGLCPACGYDLRGSTGGPCPECGTATGQPPGRG